MAKRKRQYRHLHAKIGRGKPKMSTYVPVIVAMLVLVAAVFFLSGEGPASSSTTTAVTQSQKLQAPAIRDFKSVLGGSETLPESILQGASSGAAFRYYGGNATKGLGSGTTLMVRLLYYSDTSVMNSFFGNVTAVVGGATTHFSKENISSESGRLGLPGPLVDSIVGGRAIKSPSGQTIYTISALYNNTLVTCSMTTNVDLSQDVAMDSILGAISGVQHLIVARN